MTEQDRLFEEATDLIIRLRNDPASPVALEMISQWRARSLDHEAAWFEASEIFGLAGGALKRSRADAKRRSGPSRRSVLIGFGVGAAAFAVGREALPWAIIQARADYVTGTAEITHHTLPDGSRMTLGPDSAVALSFSPTQRRVDLLAGMSYFDVVASNAAAPLLIEAQNVAATCGDGSFDISIDGPTVSLGVDRGVIHVGVPQSPTRFADELAAGRWMALTNGADAIAQGVRDTSEIAAWRDGRIVADQETVAAVVTRIARWLPGRVVLADPMIADRRVNGVFDLTQPLTALEAVVHPFGGKVRQISPFLTVITPI
ncbi:FecR domain-containing protein [Hyphomicrobium sp. D-2]|uniref:FecR family protein n=1 Tax=Hyphomicrobium sp. D-2 TaxID=3041621 RepID=UPI002458EEB0|nr:FecR domain-containing protein [Hyphomicrobium sp. D-2]MDH4981584.1 FecR domain-containing protein [Hyphomicrobium sp. D-2]